ncbi:MAG: GNAT family N-acetyltransferase [Granulosicoccus sp.]
MVELTRLSGQELAEYLPEVARLRIKVFKDYPYLYDGNLDYEKNYLNTYSRSAGSVVVLAIDHGRVVGASTAIPMAHETQEFAQPLKRAGYDVNRVFYLAESVLLAEYRGKGIGVEFFTHREAHARSIGGFDHFCFCSVQRPDNHPHRPSEYKTLDGFWKKRGYARQDKLLAHYAWKDIGETEESIKPLVFWMKTAVANVESGL